MDLGKILLLSEKTQTHQRLCKSFQHRVSEGYETSTMFLFTHFSNQLGPDFCIHSMRQRRILKKFENCPTSSGESRRLYQPIEGSSVHPTTNSLA